MKSLTFDLVDFDVPEGTDLLPDFDITKAGKFVLGSRNQKGLCLVGSLIIRFQGCCNLSCTTAY
jgi:hypothetical protein